VEGILALVDPVALEEAGLALVGMHLVDPVVVLVALKEEVLGPVVGDPFVVNLGVEDMLALVDPVALAGMHLVDLVVVLAGQDGLLAFVSGLVAQDKRLVDLGTLGLVVGDPFVVNLVDLEILDPVVDDPFVVNLGVERDFQVGLVGNPPVVLDGLDQVAHLVASDLVDLGNLGLVVGDPFAERNVVQGMRLVDLGGLAAEGKHLVGLDGLGVET